MYNSGVVLQWWFHMEWWRCMSKLVVVWSAKCGGPTTIYFFQSITVITYIHFFSYNFQLTLSGMSVSHSGQMAEVTSLMPTESSALLLHKRGVMCLGGPHFLLIGLPHGSLQECHVAPCGPHLLYFLHVLPKLQSAISFSYIVRLRNQTYRWIQHDETYVMDQVSETFETIIFCQFPDPPRSFLPIGGLLDLQKFD